MHPAVKRHLKMDAARAGLTLKSRLHSILVAHLRGQGLDPLPVSPHGGEDEHAPRS